MNYTRLRVTQTSILCMYETRDWRPEHIIKYNQSVKYLIGDDIVFGINDTNYVNPA